MGLLFTLLLVLVPIFTFAPLLFTFISSSLLLFDVQVICGGGIGDIVIIFMQICLAFTQLLN